LPFSGTWYYGDILFIIDPYIDALLLTGLLAGYYFKNIRRAAAWTSILLMCLYIGTRVELRNQAQSRLRNLTQELQSRDSRLNIQKSAVLPQMLDPRIWNGIIETDDVIMAENVGAFRGSLRGIDSDPVIMRKERPSAITERAAKARSAAVLLGFARFPVTRVEREAEGYRVIFLDFRFYNERTNTALAVEVLLDRSLNIVKESIGFTKTID
jgi:hypothetical protein